MCLTANCVVFAGKLKSGQLTNYHLQTKLCKRQNCETVIPNIYAQEFRFHSPTRVISALHTTVSAVYYAIIIMLPVVEGETEIVYAIVQAFLIDSGPGTIPEH